VNTLPDVLGSRPDDVPHGDHVAALQLAPESQKPADVAAPRAVADASPHFWLRLGGGLLAVRWTLGVYFSTRLVCLLLAIVETFFRKWTLWGMLSNWDGIWYLRVLTEGYPSHVSHVQTPLGFLPLYPLVAWPIAHLWSLHPTQQGYELAGLIVSLITGASATVLVAKLAESWSRARSCSRWSTPRDCC
jgi:hypothetical protein